ncbi:MAG: mechanosensitive ion channel, partial [Bacteroides sp.]
MEQIVEKINAMLVAMGLTPSWADSLDQVIATLLIIFIAFIADLVCRHIILKLVHKLVKQTKATWDDIVFDRKVMIHLSHLVPPVLIYIFIPMTIEKEATLDFIQRICMIYIIVVFLRFISVFLSAVYHVYNQREQFRDRPLKGLLQTAQVTLIFVGGIAIVSILINKSPVVLLTGLGASAAILMLVFKDSIMGFVSGIQLSANNMLKVGDWIAMPKYGADGTVIEVTLNTVKVRNWDNTITTI